MNIQFENISSLKCILNAMCNITEIGSWHCYQDKIVIHEMTEDAQLMCSIEIDNQYYNCENSVILTFSYEKIIKIINSIENDANVKIIYEHYTDFLTFILKEKCITTTFELKLENQNENLFNCPVFIPDCTVTLKSEDFKKIVKNLVQVDEKCTIKVDKIGISFESNGEIGNYFTSISNLQGSFIEFKKNCSVNLNSLYLLNCTDICNISEYVKLVIIANFPLKILYQPDGINVEYYLAPL